MLECPREVGVELTLGQVDEPRALVLHTVLSSVGMSLVLSRVLLGGGLLAMMTCQSSSPPASEVPARPSVAPLPAAPMQPVPGAGGTYLSRALQVTVGHSHACALVEGGAVYCWGESSQGQLGWGSWDDSFVPVRVAGVEEATAIAGGAMHTCALLSSGKVMCWGGGDLLGGADDGSTRERMQPALVTDLDGVVELTATDFTTCARRVDGTVLCWGKNLGRRPYGPGPDDHHLPVAIDAFRDAHRIAAGGMHVCAVHGADRALSCVGLDHDIDQPGIYNDPLPPVASGWQGIEALTTGGRATCFKRAGEAPWTCWGGDVRAAAAAPVAGSEGMHTLTFLGDGGCSIDATGTLACWSATPPRPPTPGLGPGTRIEGIGPVRAVAGYPAGDMSHFCAVDRQGAVLCWGDNQWGALGDGTTTARPLPVRVLAPKSTASEPLRTRPAPTGQSFTADEIAAGYDETCARSGTEIWCWGDRHGLPIADAQRRRHRPEKVTGLPAHPVEIAAGFGFMCARLTTGEVWCWGENDRGQLGDGTRRHSITPVAVKGIGDARSLSLAYGLGCVLRSGNQVSCWSDDRGATDFAKLAPWRGQIVELAVGGHLCVRLRSGEVLCQGSNDHGQIGNGEGGCEDDPSDSCAPHTRCKPRQICKKSDTFVPVIGLKDATVLALGADHSCAVRRGGRVSCWGDGSQGRLGLGDPVATITTAPREVSDLTDVAALVAGSSSTCAIRRDGQALCWGQNVWGELGERTKQNRFSPTPVHTLTDAVELSAGQSHACARRRDRTVWCWGKNDNGILSVGIDEDISRLSTPHVVRH